MEPQNTEQIWEVSKPSWKDVVKSLIFIAIAVGAAYFVTVYIGIDNVRESVSAAGIFGPLIIIVLKATTIVVVPLGGTPVYAVAGALFGFWKGLGITLIGDALGSSIAFYLSRFFGRTIVSFLVPKQYWQMVERLVVKLGEPKSYFKARIFFSGFMELFAYASGLTKVRYPVFLSVHIGVHSIVAALLVVFGDLLVSGSKLVLVIAGIASALLASAGIWWFHADLKRSS